MLTSNSPCRCYEIRCATGTVIGNYTVAGNDVVSTIPFNLTRGYTPKVDVNTVKDDYGRLWSGNDLMDQDLLFTKCYNLSQVRCCAALTAAGYARCDMLWFSMPVGDSRTTLECTWLSVVVKCIPRMLCAALCHSYSDVVPVPLQSLNLTTPTDNSIYVRVTDSCPCLQFDGGSKTVTGVNPPCCGNVNHFDLSFFGFEKLAHPIYGVMNTEFR